MNGFGSYHGQAFHNPGYGRVADDQSSFMEHLFRYHGAVKRGFCRVIAELGRLQRQRAGEDMPESLRLAIQL